MILIDENTGETKYVRILNGSILDGRALGRLTIGEIHKLVTIAGNRAPLDLNVLRHEELVRRVATHLPHRDIRTIRRFLAGEPVRGEALTEELTRAKDAAEREQSANETR
jgi:hypothetical protein